MPPTTNIGIAGAGGSGGTTGRNTMRLRRSGFGGFGFTINPDILQDSGLRAAIEAIQQPGDGVAVPLEQDTRTAAQMVAEQQRLERQRERERQAMLPIVIRVRDETSSNNGHPYFIIEVRQGDRTLDEYHESNPNRLNESIREIKRSCSARRTEGEFMRGVEGVNQVDVRADRFIGRRDNFRQRNVDRRGRRPEDDVVTEEGLVLDIPPDDQGAIEYEGEPVATLNPDNLELVEIWNDEFEPEIDQF